MLSADVSTSHPLSDLTGEDSDFSTTSNTIPISSTPIPTPLAKKPLGTINVETWLREKFDIKAELLRVFQNKTASSRFRYPILDSVPHDEVDDLFPSVDCLLATLLLCVECNILTEPQAAEQVSTFIKLGGDGRRFDLSDWPFLVPVPRNLEAASEVTAQTRATLPARTRTVHTQLFCRRLRSTLDWEAYDPNELTQEEDSILESSYKELKVSPAHSTTVNITDELRELIDRRLRRTQRTSFDKYFLAFKTRKAHLSKLRNEKTNFLRGNPARSKRSEDTYMRLLARIRTFVRVFSVHEGSQIYLISRGLLHDNADDFVNKRVKDCKDHVMDTIDSLLSWALDLGKWYYGTKKTSLFSRFKQESCPVYKERLELKQMVDYKVNRLINLDKAMMGLEEQGRLHRVEVKTAILRGVDSEESDDDLDGNSSFNS